MKGSFRPVLKVHIAFWTLAGTAWGAGPQNPFGRASNEELNAGGSFGSQNPFGSNGAADPSQGIQSNFPEHQTHGCPAIRAQAPTPDSVQTYATSRACPLADGQLYQSQDGATFVIQCCQKGHPAPLLVFEATNFDACMEKCSQTENCNSVQYAVRAGDVQQTSECQLFELGDHLSTQSSDSATHNYAFIIDPPAIDSPDVATILCSTECPCADGQQFVTSVGESFRMHCGKRHGTQVIYQDTQSTLEECIESCGKLVACHSVDYDSRRKTCYYGNHHGPPTISASSFGSAYSMGCSGACAAKGCGKTQGEVPCNPPTCSPGIERLIYDNIFKGDTAINYPSFKPEAFIGIAPESTDIVQDISFHNKDPNGPLANKAVMYRMYLYTCEAGEYKFVSNSVDDVALMWFGTKALGGYGRHNADLFQAYAGPNKTPQTVIKTIPAKTYYPIRIWFGDQGGAAILQFRVYGPSGDELTGQPAGQNFFTTKPCHKGVEEFNS